VKFPGNPNSLILEVGKAIPHQLDGDGENQEAEDLVDWVFGKARLPAVPLARTIRGL
jgi:hypothetical protein